MGPCASVDRPGTRPLRRERPFAPLRPFSPNRLTLTSVQLTLYPSPILKIRRRYKISRDRSRSALVAMVALLVQDASRCRRISRTPAGASGISFPRPRRIRPCSLSFVAGVTAPDTFSVRNLGKREDRRTQIHVKLRQIPSDDSECLCARRTPVYKTDTSLKI